jgi:3-phenylpropionate/trans-cinnamate dioxygenase ferredoxin subunit
MHQPVHTGRSPESGNSMSEFEKVAEVNELADGGRKSIVVDDRPALLVRIGSQYYAFEDVCTHDGQPLTDGPIHGNEITCPRHGARFDMTTGKALCMPATEPIATFQVEARKDGVYVKSE